MYRTNTCGELRLSDAGKEVTLAGWVQRSRKMGGMTFVDVRDRYGITQIVFNEADDMNLCEAANKLGREFCIQVKGIVSERQSKNPKMETGDIEILAKELNVLSKDERQNQGRGRQLPFLHEVADCTERHGHADVPQAAIHAVHPVHAHQQDQREKHKIGNEGNSRPPFGHREDHDQQ